MTSRLISVCLDANDPDVMARFWSAALRWKIDASREWIDLRPTDTTPVGILFEPTSEHKRGQNRHHLDLTTTSLDDQLHTVDQLIELGGRRIDIGQSPDDDHVVLADPEGNELCILGPGNNFLAGCGRLGAVNLDGTRATGVFWSEALGIPLTWDQDEETAFKVSEVGPMLQWSGPPLIPKHGKNRLHLDIAPPAGSSQADEVKRLLSLGASHVDIGQVDVNWVVLADPDGNEFCVLTPR